MRAWTPLWSRILQEMTPIFFEHPDKLNLVMLEGGQRDSQLRGTNRRNFMSNFLLPSHHGPKQMLSWTKTKAIMDQNKCFYTEIFTASWHQQKRLHVTSKINFLLPKPNSWEENYLLYSNTKEFSNHRELFRG